MEILLMSFLIPPLLIVLSFVLKYCWKNKNIIRHFGMIKGLVVNCIFSNQGKLPKDWQMDSDDRAVMSSQMKEHLSISKINWKVDQDNLDNYRFLCGYESFEPSVLLDPPCYPEIAFIIPTMSIISSKQFPLSPLGLIHINQTIKVYCPLNLEDSLNFLLDLSTSEMRATSKGIEVDFLFKVYNPDKELAWESVMTVLSRDKSTRHRNKTGPTTTRSNDDTFQEDNTVAFNVPESVGWEYASVSSDYNPHHLNSFTSKLATGYPRPMAHGMWTLGRVIAVLNNKITDQSVYPLFINAQFKRPLFLPNSALLKYKAIKPSIEECPQFKYKDYHSKAIAFRVFSEDLLNSSSSTLSSLNMIGFITYKADIQP